MAVTKKSAVRGTVVNDEVPKEARSRQRPNFSFPSLPPAAASGRGPRKGNGTRGWWKREGRTGFQVDRVPLRGARRAPRYLPDDASPLRGGKNGEQVLVKI